MTSTNISSGPVATTEKNDRFQVYPERWAVLLTVVLLNISNAAIWVSFFPVASTTANFFGVTPSKVNMFSFVFLVVPMVLFFPTTYLSNRVGLKFMVHCGSVFNFGGAAIKSLGTSGFIKNKKNQYIVCLLGQAVASVAQTFGLYIPTKVSNSWFPKEERRTATGILSFAYPVGLMLAQLTTPLYVKDEADIPTLDYVGLAAAGIVEASALLFMKRSHPKTPPSESAEHRMTTKASYVQQWKDTFASKNYVLLLLMLSCGIGFVDAVNTLTQQIICNVGYSYNFAGECIAIMFVSAFVGAIVIHQAFNLREYWEEIIKTLSASSIISFILTCQFLVIPNKPIMLGLGFGLFGFFTTGLLPSALELCVELTYPVDESLITGLIYLLGKTFAVVIIVFIPLLARDAPYNSSSTCDLDSSVAALDYSISVSVSMVVFTIFFTALIMFFSPEYKRRDYEKNVCTGLSKHLNEDDVSIIIF